MDDCLECCIFVLVCEQMFNEVCVIFGFHSSVTEDLSLLDLAELIRSLRSIAISVIIYQLT